MTKVKERRQTDLTEGPLFGKMLKFSFPLIATGLLQTLYNATDMVVVGRYSGNIAMGAVGSCGSLINLIIGAFLGITVGTGVLVAQYIGAQKQEDVERVVHTSLLAGIIGGIIIGVLGFFFAGPMLSLMNPPEDIYNEAVPYLKAYFVGVPASMVYNFLATALRSEGNTKTAFGILAVSGIVNVVLNMIFVLCFGMGAVGVGIATAISMYVSAILIIIYMFKADIRCKLSLKKMRIDLPKLKNIIRIGIPSGIQSSLFSISNVLIQSTVNSYGDIFISGNAAAANIEGFIYVAMNAFNHAALTFVGQNIGAKKYDRVKKTMIQCTLTVAVVGFGLGLLAYSFGDTLLSIYEPHNELVRQAGLQRMSVVSVTYFLCGVMEVGSGSLKALGKPFLSMVISLLGACLLRIVWVETLCKMFPMNSTVLYISYPVSWVLTTAALFISAYIYYKKISGRGREKEKVISE